MDLHHYEFHAMASKNQLSFYAQNRELADAAARQVVDEVSRIEEKYSRYKTDSVLSKVNNMAGIGKVCVDDEFLSIMQFAETCYRESNGTFDLSSGVLRQAWDFTNNCLPVHEQVERLLPLVCWDNVKWSCEDKCVWLTKPGMQLDFGGIGKEYAVDRSTSILKDNNISNGIINFAGDIMVLGPHPDEKPWNIAIQHPRDDGVFASIGLSYGAIATSGDYERYIIVDNKRYCHILNPVTGYPVEDSFQSVSVIASQCVLAGSTATIAMLKGDKEGKNWLKNTGLQHLYIDSRGVASNIDVTTA